MKTKAWSLTLASVMAFQSVGFANTNRVQGIGDQAIAAAQADLGQVKTQISAFDQALAKAEEAIVNKDHKGNISNGLAIGAGALGLALGALTVIYANKAIQPGNPSTVAYGILLVPLTIAITTISSVAGLTNTAVKSAADVSDAKQVLAQTEKAAANVDTQKLNDQESLLITQLRSNLAETKAALATYENNGNELSRNRLTSHVAQLAGTVLGVAAIVASINDGYRYSLPAGTQYLFGAGMAIGGLTAMGGNLATIVTGLQSYQSESVLKEIRETRESLKNVAASLK